MADSDVAVCNIALAEIGDQAIVSLGDDAARARALNLMYLPILDAMLRSHNWNFAQFRVALNRLTATPAFDFTYMYELPTAPLCLIVLETSLDENEPWRIETYQTGSASYRVLITDASSVNILYVGRVTDVSRWDPLFADAMSIELAARICYALTRNASLQDVLEKKAVDKWRIAKSRDGQEGRALKKLLSNQLLRVRT